MKGAQADVVSTGGLEGHDFRHDFQNVRGTLHLPPGWTLFSAAGVDVLIHGEE